MNSRVFNPFEELKKKGILEALALLPRTLRFVFRVSPAYFVLSNSISIVQAGIAALVLLLSKAIIDRCTATIGEEIVWLYLLAPVIALVAVEIFRSLISSGSQIITYMLGERVQNEAHSQLLHKATRLDMAFYESASFYDRLYQARQNMYNLQQAIFSVLQVVSQLFTLVAMWGILSVLHPFATLLLFATIAPRILFEGYSARRQFELDVELTRNFRISNYFKSILKQREIVKEVRVFRLGKFFIQRYLDCRELVIKALLSLNLHFLRFEVGFDLLSMTGLALLYVYAVYKTGNGNMTIGELYMVFRAAQNTSGAIESLLRSGGRVFSNSLYLTRFFELLDLDPQTVDGALEPARLSSPKAIPKKLKKGIEFNNVSFRYPGTEDWILRDITFSVPARSKLAIVGENGAGKTTLIKLLARFYDPNDGFILLDGVDYRDYDRKDMTDNITVVFQDFARYDISASDNIGVGNVEYLDERDRIIRSARKGGAHDAVMKLPSQYDTVLGRTFEEGVDISGGEWQNLAISRAFMNDAQIFILDEPTAALDAFKEAEIYERFSQFTQNRTVVLVSHRFSTVRMADLIIVVEDGRVIENGSHDDLIRANGKYRKMFDAQAERYL